MAAQNDYDRPAAHVKQVTDAQGRVWSAGDGYALKLTATGGQVRVEDGGIIVPLSFEVVTADESEPVRHKVDTSGLSKKGLKKLHKRADEDAKANRKRRKQDIYLEAITPMMDARIRADLAEGRIACTGAGTRSTDWLRTWTYEVVADDTASGLPRGTAVECSSARPDDELVDRFRLFFFETIENAILDDKVGAP